jgi:hypothetical protein
MIFIILRPKDFIFPKSVLIPKRSTVYDYIYIRNNVGAWNLWSSLIETQPIASNFKVKINKII